jgi:hypothetical protein
MKRMMKVVFALMLTVLFFPGISFCQEMTTQEIEKELKRMKERINKLEDKLKKKDHEIEKLKKETVKRADMPDVAAAESEGGLLDGLLERISIGGLVEVGAGYKSTDYNDGTDDGISDINLTTVEIGVEIEVNDWVNLETVFLYEDPFDDEETSVDLDAGTATFGNTEECPFYVTVGKMFVPFGALLTHLPDDPAVDQPMSLLLGEASEKAVLAGYENSGISLSGYVFNGDMDESGDNTIESFGFDANYTTSEDSSVEMLLGASYVSNIADSDGLTDLISGNVDELEEYVDGFVAYLQLGISGFFFDAEYMSALDEFDPTELATEDGDGAEPSVWNIEAGYNWNWGKNLEIVLKYAGSDETEALGFPEDRYGIGFNQEIFEGVIGSAAFLKDEYHNGDADDRDDGYTALGQIAIEF